MVEVRTGSPPALVAFRAEASSTWQTLPAAGKTTVDFARPDGPYRVTVVCEAIVGPGTQINLVQFARTPDDDPVIVSTCTASGTVHLSGSVSVAGEISIGNIGQAGGTANWPFNLLVAPGTADVVLLSGNLTTGFDGIATRRNVSVPTTDTLLGTLDFAAEGGQPLVATTYTGDLRPGETMQGTTVVQIGSTLANLETGPAMQDWTVKLMPSALLIGNDSQRVNLAALTPPSSATSQSSFRRIVRETRVGDPTAVTLPDPVGPVTLDATDSRLTATWSTLPSHDEIALLRQAVMSGSNTLHELRASQRFVDATHATSLVLDLSDLPGFKPTWQIQPGEQEFRDFIASNGLLVMSGPPPAESTSSGVGVAIAPPPPTSATLTEPPHLRPAYLVDARQPM